MLNMKRKITQIHFFQLKFRFLYILCVKNNNLFMWKILMFMCEFFYFICTFLMLKNLNFNVDDFVLICVQIIFFSLFLFFSTHHFDP